MKDGRIKVLWISPFAVHDKVGHAGGQTFNYYLKNFCSDELFQITCVLIGEQNPDDLRLMLEQYSCYSNFDLQQLLCEATSKKRFCFKATKLSKVKLIRRALKYFKLLSDPSNMMLESSYRRCLLDYLISRKQRGYEPDVVILEWTQTVFLSSVVKKCFPKSVLVATEHDVSFQAVERKIAGKTMIERILLFNNSFLRRFKQKEIQAVARADIVNVFSQKDILLLSKSGITEDKINILTSFYQTYSRYNVIKDGIAFYGAMNRFENQDAVSWFLNNVWKDSDIPEKLKFYIIGSGLPDNVEREFTKYKNVICTGFVDDPGYYFSKSYCLVAPLRYGAGIKVKVLEAMNFGLPVLTNDIGIEGIPAINGVHYLHCSCPKDYHENIKLLVKDETIRNKLSTNAQDLIRGSFKLKDSFDKYKAKILQLMPSKE